MIQKFAYEIINRTVTVWRCFSYTDTAEIPEEIDGYPVTRIAPYAFSAHMRAEDLKGKLYSSQEALPALCGNRLQTIRISKTVKQVGRYCFYNCEQLRHIFFTDELGDWGSGVFTGCHQVERLSVLLYGTGRSTLKDVLAELQEPVTVDYNRIKDGKKEFTRLVFPEFYEEGIENTPARLINLQIHGSGMLYRNCFQQRILDFTEYDSRFPYAVFQEKFEIVASLAEGRLRYPLELSEEARKQYESYILEHRLQFSKFLLERKEMDALEWYLGLLEEKKTLKKELFRQMTEYCIQVSWQEGLSYLMDCGHRFCGQKKRKSFEL